MSTVSRFQKKQTDRPTRDAMILDADSSNSVVVVTAKQSATGAAIRQDSKTNRGKVMT